MKFKFGIKLVIPGSLEITSSGEISPLFNSKDGDIGYNERKEEDNLKIIGLAINDDLRKLANSEIWFLGGTFKACIQIFYQIYTIHYFFHAPTFPDVYILLTGKTHDL